MRRPYQDENEYTFIENKARELGGYDDASLLREAAEAERVLEKERAEHPEKADRLDQELDAGFERLKVRIREKGIRPVCESGRVKEEKSLPGRVSGVIGKKTAMLVVIVLVLTVGGGAAATAKSRHRYNVYPSSGKNIRMISNTAMDMSVDDLEQVYQKIIDVLQIPVIEFNYLPDNMKVNKFAIDTRCAVLELKNEENQFIIRMTALTSKDYVDISVSDRDQEKMIYNDWISQKIPIEKNVLKNGVVEYSAAIKGESGYYSLEGRMKEEEFLEIVRGIYFASQEGDENEDFKKMAAGVHSGGCFPGAGRIPCVCGRGF